MARRAVIVAHTLLVAQRVCAVEPSEVLLAVVTVGISGALHVTVVAIAALIGFVKCSHHPSNNREAADDLDDAGDEEHHHRLREGVVGGPLLGLAWVRVGVVGVRTAVNFPAPSSADFGAQHMRMLEATQARMPMMAPMMPVRPTRKPSIEKMELPHTCSAHEETELAGAGAVHVPGTGKIE